MIYSPFSMGSTLAGSTPLCPFCFSITGFSSPELAFLVMLDSRSHWGRAGLKCDVNRLLFNDWLLAWSAVCQRHEKAFTEVAERMTSPDFTADRSVGKPKKLKRDYKNIKYHNGGSNCGSTSLLEDMVCYFECLLYFKCLYLKLISCLVGSLAVSRKSS
ncbi:hypothetical protein ILYODFUR_013594 [Ilyodon furcidens]|uniref:Uncharacterized protein n=1 Tax=Ilyodon furcidens TaxID=33524 RepID=A0ABV0VFC0_9TELE